MENYARLFLKTLYGHRHQEKFALHAFVLMPDHVHLILTPAADVTLERVMQFIKGGYSHAAGKEISRREIWQKGFTDLEFVTRRILPGIGCISIRMP